MEIGIDYVGVTTPFYCHDGRGNLLMHVRSANCRDEQGKWDPGSGKLEPHLTIEENVLREVFEEYCVNGTITGVIPAHDLFREHNDKQTHWVAIPHFVKVNRSQVKIGEPNKIEQIGWFKLNHLPAPLHIGFTITLNRFYEIFQAELRVP